MSGRVFPHRTPKVFVTQVSPMTNVVTPAAPIAAQPAPTQSVTLLTPQDNGSHDLMLNISSISSWALAIAGIVGLSTIIYRVITRELKREIDMLRHKLNTTTTKVESLEHFRFEDVARFVKLETSIANIEKRFDRLEDTIRDSFDRMMSHIGREK